ncbi:MAG: nucleotidyltransferase family protein [Geobacteraceae bacterium]|jgi:predicted nucleotidyltransferase
MSQISVPDELIREFCQRNGIKRLSLFGSVLRADFRPNSDIDVLIEFVPGNSAGLLAMARMERELSELFGRKVDLRTPAELSSYFRDEVLKHSETRYAA